jgi:hypothetical protein
VDSQDHFDSRPVGFRVSLPSGSDPMGYGPASRPA